MDEGRLGELGSWRLSVLGELLRVLYQGGGSGGRVRREMGSLLRTLYSIKTKGGKGELVGGQADFFEPAIRTALTPTSNELNRARPAPGEPISRASTSTDSCHTDHINGYETNPTN